MMASGLPLRDRRQSTTPEPDPAWLVTPTTPLRIAKRDSPQPNPGAQLSRRQSNSYKHLKSNRLVSKSPFRSQAADDEPPRVSGEKRPRPLSMAAQAENEHPLGFKRRQSKVFEGLLVKEPVSNSPFKQPEPVPDPPLLPPKLAPPLPVPSSPARPSLVSKRLHGPRGTTTGSVNSRRHRRKTVSFDERCEVVEFDVEEDEFDEDVFESGEEDEFDDEREEDGDDVDDDDDSVRHPQPSEESYDSSQAGNDSITGLMDSMLKDHSHPSPHSLPSDIDSVDSVPYGPTRAAFDIDVPGATTPRPPRIPAANPSSPLDSPVPPSKLTLASLAPADAHEPFEEPLPSPYSPEHRVLPDIAEDDTLPYITGERDVMDARLSARYAENCSLLLDVHSKPLPPPEPSTPPQLPSDAGMDPTHLSIGHSEVSLHGLARSEPLTTDETPPISRAALSSPPSSMPPVLAPDKSRFSDSQARASPLLDRIEPSPISLPRGLTLTPPVPPKDGVPPSPLSLASGLPPPVWPFIASQTGRRGLGSPLRRAVETRLDNDTSIISDPSAKDTEPDDMEHEADDEQDAKIGTESLVRPRMNRAMNLTHDGVLALDPEPQPIDPPRPTIHTRAHTDTVTPLQEPALGEGLDESRPPAQRLEDVSALDQLIKDVAQTSTNAPSAVEHAQAQVDAVAEGIKALQFDNIPTPSDEAAYEIETVDARRPGHARSRSEPAPLEFRISPPDEDEERPAPAPAPVPMPPTKDRDDRGRDVVKETQETEGRPGKRRTKSASAVEVRSGGLLDMLPIEKEDPLEYSINRELKRLEVAAKSKYRVREHKEMIYATSDVGHASSADIAVEVEPDRAWKTVRQPSDMNEYADQIRELHAQDKSGKMYGKVFVKVLGIKSIVPPIPDHPTVINCTLNNGIHYVTTPECRLERECRIEQEFELIEHSKLEFTLTIKVRRDPHIIMQFKANDPPPPPPTQPVTRQAPPPASKGGKRPFFWQSGPKKNSRAIMPPPAATPAPVPASSEPRMVENLARYLKGDGTFARAFVSFRDIAARCDTKLLETSYPLIGQRAESKTTTKTMQVGEIMLQIFRLPPLPGVAAEQLPQSLEECHRGLRHTAWHKVTYFEGTLTQYGGDCNSWRRRHFRLTGSKLVAHNDVTKKITSVIDLRKLTAVEDDEDIRSSMKSPSSGSSSHSRHLDEFDGPYGAQRSFRLLFTHDQVIVFFADTDEDKARWLEVLRALVGRIPPNPLWAELVWHHQQELAKQTVQPKMHNSAPNR
ncbi:uncharacterized protein LAESUDRAFT_727601 [Laetiporus sulphureus 93-53]|uniref:PH domain-containing protein n=1 Tax=Laetiporus sulphureus 93-53 TaxID=1314785 RepID=A0A165DET2_9APHY|nr:uncharacterized protein LAESUDRAFT_727601 [Laetiporus sulphureus 93-53]KZT04730.1 hypothetical protein LAESUDRAFT_727601 [Laetiporus sulphureus 93-53]